MDIKHVTAEDFEDSFGEDLSQAVREKIDSYEFAYRDLTSKEEDRLLIHIMEHISQPLVKAGSHREEQWQTGWDENRKDFLRTENTESLIPRYFGKFPYVRWKQKFIKPVNPNFEYQMAAVLQYWLFDKYFKKTNNIYEFGCGTGHNLLRTKSVNPDASICGLDWVPASQHIISLINSKFDQNFDSHRFNFFDIDYDFSLKENACAYTFAALEQVGESCNDFVEYLIRQNCDICVHIEPIAELLDPENSFIDYLSVKYFKKRGYLYGLYNTLKKYEKDGRIEIIQAQRSYIGSQYIDGYSVVAWRNK
jgi:hypothetical protein